MDSSHFEGFMRDYCIKLDKPIDTPTPTEIPESSGTEEVELVEIDPSVLGTGKTNHDANLRKFMNGTVLTQLREGKKVNILGAEFDKKGKIWYHVRPDGSKTEGYILASLINLDKGVVIPAPVPTAAPTSTPAPDASQNSVSSSELPPSNTILDREIIGRAATNRAANVRSKPVSNAKVVRQLSKNVKLFILGVYTNQGEVWYEVSTETGKVHGYVRDYVIQMMQIDDAHKEPVEYTE